MAAQKSVLGRGLGALISDYQNPQSPASQTQSRPVSGPAAVSEIPVDKIVPNPYQPRLSFDENALEELADSIRTLGIIQPITLRKTADGSYQIISGERRFRASKLAGLKSVPAYIRNADDAAMLEMAIVENIQRENLDAIETALGFQRLIDECSLTQEAMAIRVGKKRATVTNYLRLLKLPPEIQKAIKIGAISTGHAKAILSLEDPVAQMNFCEKAIREELSVRALEEKIQRFLDGPKPQKRTESLGANYDRIVNCIGRMGGNASVRRSGRGSVLTVKFKNDSEAEAFLKNIENIS